MISGFEVGHRLFFCLFLGTFSVKGFYMAVRIFVISCQQQMVVVIWTGAYIKAKFPSMVYIICSGCCTKVLMKQALAS